MLNFKRLNSKGGDPPIAPLITTTVTYGYGPMKKHYIHMPINQLIMSRAPQNPSCGTDLATEKRKEKTYFLYLYVMATLY